MTATFVAILNTPLQRIEIQNEKTQVERPPLGMRDTAPCDLGRTKTACGLPRGCALASQMSSTGAYLN